MPAEKPLKIGITCHPTVGGSGVIAAALGEELARRGHEIHFISYQEPFRLRHTSETIKTSASPIRFHQVGITDYGLFKYPDYTLPLSVRMAEVSRDFGLDVLHVHYAVPHATAAILARSMLPPHQQPRIVTTLHGTDTTLLGRDDDYGPAIRHALKSSDAITAVSNFLAHETQKLFSFEDPIEVIHNFFSPRPATRSRDEVRAELGLRDEVMILHSSNLRPVKRIDLLLETVARVRPRDSFKLVVLAGEDFSPFEDEVRRLNLAGRIVVRHRINEIEDYLQAADLALYTSEMESFCLGILESMCFECCAVATRVGGIPEVVEDNITGLLAEPGDPDALAAALQTLIQNPQRRHEMGRAAQTRARHLFGAEAIVPRYEFLYRRVCQERPRNAT
jgi:N-acetyl-alpha-D-glucosaminyl L-malate synthase BshA